MSSPNSRLYLIDNSQYEATQTFLARYLPYSTSILTWFTRTLASQIAGLDDFSIYSSHSQLPSGTYNEPVTIIVKQVDRLRVFVSTEAQLNEEDPVWVGEDDIGLEKGDFHFGDMAVQDLYETSKKGLERAIRYGNWNMDDIFFHGLSVLWCPLMYQMFKVPYNGPCERYICPAGQYLNNNVLDTLQANGEELIIDTANEGDFDQIKNLNKIAYQSAYVTECCKISTVLRKSDGDMVAWAFTHSDGAIGALHVLPEWRRLGLAQVVVDNLCVKQAQAFVNLPIKHQIYLQAIAENFNTASKNMFKKLGWSKSDIGITWIRCQAKK